MSSTDAFRIASRLGLLTTVLMFGLIVVGSVVRTTGSGLACPDWPLCEGRLIPRFESHVLTEWFHRLLALLVSVMVLATAGWVAALAPLRARLGGLAALSAGLLCAQVLLGALTVWKHLSPSIVSSHLAVALLLFSTLLTVTLIASAAARPAAAGRPAATAAPRGAAPAPRRAGLACPDWPTCNGQWFPPLEGAVGLQMTHRWGGYLLTLVVLLAAARARAADAPGVRRGATVAALLTMLQVALGVSNVLLGTPPWASALHLANAAALLATLVTTTYRAAAPAALPLRAAVAT